MAELPVQKAAADLASATSTSPAKAATTAGVEEFLCFEYMVRRPHSALNSNGTPQLLAKGAPITIRQARRASRDNNPRCGTYHWYLRLVAFTLRTHCRTPDESHDCQVFQST
jgi:hypothetical protein